MTDTAHADVRAILRKLGGKSDNVRFRNLHQVVIKPVTNMCCWVSYMTKDLIDMPAAERDSFIYLSQSATRIGREQLPKLKALASQKLGITAEWRGKSGVHSQSDIQVITPSVIDMTRH